MNEEQIAEMYRFDLEVFHSDRRYAEHNEQFPESNFEDGGEDNSPLMKHHLDAMSVGIEQSLSSLPDWWIEEIDDPALVKAIKKLSEANGGLTSEAKTRKRMTDKRRHADKIDRASLISDSPHT